MQFTTIDEILDFAINREEEAAKLYASLAAKVNRPGMREAFLDFAAEEGRHKARLMKIKAGEIPVIAAEKVADLKITETLVQPEVSANMTYQEALLFAMKAEKVAYKLYMDLAALTAGTTFAGVFTSLALEEAKHKLRFEVEYDDHVLEGV